MNGIQLESLPPQERFLHGTLNTVGLLTDLDALTIWIWMEILVCNGL